jgi:hypothetical protein
MYASGRCFLGEASVRTCEKLGHPILMLLVSERERTIRKLLQLIESERDPDMLRALALELERNSALDAFPQLTFSTAKKPKTND